MLDPEATCTVDPAELEHRNRVTAYAGRTLHGVVTSTRLRGERIADRGVLAAPSGRPLDRTRRAVEPVPFTGAGDRAGVRGGGLTR